MVQVHNRDIEILKYELEHIRSKLDSILSERKMTHQEVLGISRELDKLIVVYQKLMMRRE